MYREIHHVGRRGDGRARTGFQGAFLHGVERITPDVEEAKGERDQSRAEQSRAEKSPRSVAQSFVTAFRCAVIQHSSIMTNISPEVINMIGTII